MQIILAITALVNAIAAVLAWIAKIRWSNEYADAKDETIRAKEAQIDFLEREIASLKELTPMKIREYFISTRKQLEEYNDSLQEKLDMANQELEDKQKAIENIRSSGDEKSQELSKLEAERNELADASKKLENQLKNLRAKYEDKNVTTIRIPNISSKIILEMNDTLKEMNRVLAKDISSDLQNMTKGLAQSIKFGESFYR